MHWQIVLVTIKQHFISYRDFNNKYLGHLVACAPVICILVSILDLCHPLRGGSSMGQGCTAKTALVVTIIHLDEEKHMECKHYHTIS